MSLTTLELEAIIAKSDTVANRPTSLTVNVAPSVEIVVLEGAVASVRPAAVTLG